MSDVLPKFHFEAQIRLFGADEGGYVWPVRNAIRPSFTYKAFKDEGHWLVFPTFLDSEGAPLSHEKDLEMDAWLPAAMTILADDLRQSVHGRRLRVGTEFALHEGFRKVGEGVVTKLLPCLMED